MENQPKKPILHRDAYTFGWICSLDIEYEAACLMLDEQHKGLDSDDDDFKLYTLGRMKNQSVVIAALSTTEPGQDSVASVADQMKLLFPSLNFFLIVGIGSGVPTADAAIRLGDVVVS